MQLVCIYERPYKRFLWIIDNDDGGGITVDSEYVLSDEFKVWGTSFAVSDTKIFSTGNSSSLIDRPREVETRML